MRNLSLFLVALFIGQFSYAQSANSVERININTLAPHLPLPEQLSFTNTKSESKKQEIKATPAPYRSATEAKSKGGQEIEDWTKKYYEEYDKVRNYVVAMFTDGNVVLYTTLNGKEVDATSIYRLNEWELDYGLNDAERAKLRARIGRNQE